MMTNQTIALEPIGYVVEGRSEVKDDFWGKRDQTCLGCPAAKSSRLTD